VSGWGLVYLEPFIIRNVEYTLLALRTRATKPFEQFLFAASKTQRES
jgi:hypothetical protein